MTSPGRPFPGGLMALVRRFGAADLILLLAVVGVAGGARAGYLLLLCDGARDAGPLRVQEERPALPPSFQPPAEGLRHPTDLGLLAHNIHQHQSFSTVSPFPPVKDDEPVQEQTAHLAPGYPHVLAFFVRAFGPD